MKLISSIIFLVILLTLGLAQRPSIITDVHAEESEPRYSATISIGKRNVYGSQRLNVTFDILGMGSISSGWILVSSDDDNILVSQYRHKCFISSHGSWIAGPEHEPVGGEEKGISTGVPVSPIDVPTDGALLIIGGFVIDTSETPIGPHKLKVAFIVQANGQNHIFEDSIEYRMIGFLEKYPLSQFLIPAGISVCTSVIVLKIAEYLNHQKERRNYKKREEEE